MSLNELKKISEGLKLSERMPVMFIGHGSPMNALEDNAFTRGWRAAAQALPAEPWDATTWAGWTAAVKAATGRKGRALFHPLRLALTGYEAGPELAALLPLIGRARASARLAGRSS
jgi:glutamyl/glutaminyl-tRNA synthetase